MTYLKGVMTDHSASPWRQPVCTMIPPTEEKGLLWREPTSHSRAAGQAVPLIDCEVITSGWLKVCIGSQSSALSTTANFSSATVRAAQRGALMLGVPAACPSHHVPAGRVPTVLKVKRPGSQCWVPPNLMGSQVCHIRSPPL